MALVKGHVGLTKALLGEVELEGGAGPDVAGDLMDDRFVDKHWLGKGRSDLDVTDMRQARAKLSEMMRELDAIAYKAQEWGDLTRHRLSNNSIRWLCPVHAPR